MDHQDPRLARIGRLAATARGLEREGAYNGAKLVRAALERELIRYAEAEAPAGMADVAAAVRDLGGGAAAEPASWSDRLATVAATVAAGGTISLADVPAARVCRVCGELFIGDDVPPTCPACEAPALSFREIPPVWYLEHAEPGTILAALAAGPGHVTAAIAGHDDEALDRAPAPGEWSARETLRHLVFTETLLAGRIVRLLAEDEPDLVAWSVTGGQASGDEGFEATDEPASALAARYRALRHQTVEQLRTLDDASWARAGRHPEWGRVTVLSQAAYFARHEASHLAQLVAAAQGRLPGRPQA
jgi:Zn finger protein HypA/HybF involved in hydrogenase expression